MPKTTERPIRVLRGASRQQDLAATTIMERGAPEEVRQFINRGTSRTPTEARRAWAALFGLPEPQEDACQD